LELDRNAIERRDFSATRRGYDPDEVDRHLREVADEVEQLKRSQREEPATPSSIATQAAEQVRGIVEAAERSAAEIQERAQAEAQRARDDADREARQSREKADADAVERVRRAEEATERMLERTAGVESEIDALLAEVRSAANGFVERLRDGSGSLHVELTSIREELAGVRDARLEPAGAAATAEAAEAEPEIVTEEGEEVAAEAVEDVPAVEEEAVEEEPAVEEEEVLEEEPVAEKAVVEEEEEEEALEEEPAEAEPAGRSIRGAEGARLIALNMALNGTPRDETARYLSQNFDLEDQDALLDEVYARVGG
jgi:DivIVA domain-containing protein